MPRTIAIETVSNSHLILEMLKACFKEQSDLALVSEWLRLPHPALTGATPPQVLLVFLRNTDGLNIIRWILARVEAIAWLQVIIIGPNPEPISQRIPVRLRSRFTLLSLDHLMSMTIIYSTIRRITSYHAQEESSGSLVSISPRQEDILALIAEGYSNQVIAESLNLSEKTVENQINVLYQKLGISQRDPHINSRVMATHLAASLLPAPREPEGA